MKVREALISPDSEYYIYTPSLTAKKLFFSLTQIGLYQYEPGYRLKRRSLDSFLFMLILEGNCSIRLERQAITASQGSLVFLDCYAPHQYESTTGWKALWIHFDGPLARDYYTYLSGKWGNVMTPSDFQTITYEVEQILKTFQTGSAVCESRLSMEITNILNRLVDMVPKDSPVPGHTVRDCISYINEHFSESLTLKDLSEKACLSPFYFTRIFAKEVGMTPYQYLLSTRISTAKFLLKSTSFSVKEIGYRCGFSSESSFCSAFKKWENKTPGKYRSEV